MSEEANQDGPRRVELTPQPSVAVRQQQPMTELNLAELFDTHLPNIADQIVNLGGTPAGPPYGRYHQFGPDQVDVEIGIRWRRRSPTCGRWRNASRARWAAPNSPAARRPCSSIAARTTP